MAKKTTIEDQRTNYYWQRIHAYGKKDRTFDWNAMEVLLNMNLTYTLLDSSLSLETRRHGLSRAALNVLSILSHSEGQKGCRQHEISKLMLVSRANITGLIEGLIKQGLVERAYDKNDRRVCIARISKKGAALVRTFLPRYYKHASGLFSGLSKSEKQKLSVLLRKVRLGINRKIKAVKS